MSDREHHETWENWYRGIWGSALVVVGLIWLLPGNHSEYIWPVFVIAAGLCLLSGRVVRRWERPYQRYEEPAERL